MSGFSAPCYQPPRTKGQPLRPAPPSHGISLSRYLSYIWSEVLDADAFAAFEEAQDIFHPPTSRRLHDHIYAAGGSRDPAALYESFRGRLPTPDALLRKRGLLDETGV
jgi:peptidyl-dipeptidase Dcp